MSDQQLSADDTSTNTQSSSKRTKLHVGTLNVRGCKTLQDKKNITRDAYKYNFQVLAIQETHIASTNLETHTHSSNSHTTTYDFFYTGPETDKTYHGVGLVIDSSLSAKFEKVSDRICKATFNLDNNQQTKQNKVTVISAYAPTLEKSKTNPQLREDFYNQLTGTLNKTPKNHLTLVLGDFNAKVGSGWANYPENLGKFGKGHVNENGEQLLELCKLQNLVLTNTLFQHKLAHITTWTAPLRTHYKTKDGTETPLLGPDGKPRRNPFRN